MKKIKHNFLMVIGLISILSLVGCKRSNSPVDQYVDLIEQAISKIEKINSPEGLENIQDYITKDKTEALEKEYSDYVLTDEDKEKLKKSMDKLIRTVYETMFNYSGFPEKIKEMKKDQVEMLVAAANQQIDKANTLGEISGL